MPGTNQKSFRPTAPAVFGYLALLSALVIATAAHAEPRVRQLDPPQSVLLGQAVYWVIEARYPVWESYELLVQPQAGMSMEVEQRSDRRAGDEMATLFRVRIVPRELILKSPPAAILSGTAGAASLTVKRMEIRAISGASLEVKQPEVPRFPAGKSHAPPVGEVLIVLLLGAWGYVRWKRWWEAKPRQRLLRELRELQRRTRVRRPADPAWLCRLFRSDLLWGEPVDAATVAELRERSGKDTRLSSITEAMEKFEEARYTGAMVRDQALVSQCVYAAMEVLGAK